MAEEGSRAIHEEFILAEGGDAPRPAGARRAGPRRQRARLDAPPRPRGRGRLGGRRARPGRARRALVGGLRRAARGPGAGGARRRGAARGLGRPGRRPARRGADRPLPPLRRGAGDPGPALADQRAAGVRAAGWRRAGAGGRGRAAARWRRGAGRLGLGAGAARPGAHDGRHLAPSPTRLRVREAAAVWAHVRVLAEALEQALGARPGPPPEHRAGRPRPDSSGRPVSSVHPCEVSIPHAIPTPARARARRGPGLMPRLPRPAAQPRGPPRRRPAPRRPRRARPGPPRLRRRRARATCAACWATRRPPRTCTRRSSSRSGAAAPPSTPTARRSAPGSSSSPAAGRSTTCASASPSRATRSGPPGSRCGRPRATPRPRPTRWWSAGAWRCGSAACRSTRPPCCACASTTG